MEFLLVDRLRGGQLFSFVPFSFHVMVALTFSTGCHFCGLGTVRVPRELSSIVFY